MKTNYRIVVLGIVIIFYSAALFAQSATRDVVYLKNGSVIHGIIIETIPNTSIKIQTADGNIFVYSFSDIEKYGRESVNDNESRLVHRRIVKIKTCEISLKRVNLTYGVILRTSLEHVSYPYDKNWFRRHSSANYSVSKPEDDHHQTSG